MVNSALAAPFQENAVTFFAVLIAPYIRKEDVYSTSLANHTFAVQVPGLAAGLKNLRTTAV